MMPLYSYRPIKYRGRPAQPLTILPPNSLARQKEEFENGILQQNSLAQHWAQDWARDWRALALTQVHHWSRLSDSGEDGEALSSVHSTALAVGKLIHNLLCDGRVKND